MFLQVLFDLYLRLTLSMGQKNPVHFNENPVMVIFIVTEILLTFEGESPNLFKAFRIFSLLIFFTNFFSLKGFASGSHCIFISGLFY